MATRRKRRFPVVSDLERATILAALRDEECPAGGNPFLHLDPFAGVDGRARTLSVFRSLPPAERRALILRRRAERSGGIEW
jgi:hypothetical protein